MIPTPILYVRLISDTTAKAGINSVKSYRILMIGDSINSPTTSKAGASTRSIAFDPVKQDTLSWPSSPTEGGLRYISWLVEVGLTCHARTPPLR